MSTLRYSEVLCEYSEVLHEYFEVLVKAVHALAVAVDHFYHEALTFAPLCPDKDLQVFLFGDGCF